MCGCSLVCSDTPSCLGLQDKHGRSGVEMGLEALHGDRPTSPDANDANAAHCKAAADHRGIEAEAISRRGLHHAAADW